jgi:hypothetical protein
MLPQQAHGGKFVNFIVRPHTDTQESILITEELPEAVFSLRSNPKSYKEDILLRKELQRLPELSDSNIQSLVQWDSEQRITVMVRVSSNLAVSQSGLCWRGPAAIYWTNRWDSEPRMTVLARASSLPDKTMEEFHDFQEF